MRLRSNGFYGGEMIVVYSMNEHAIYIQSVTAFVPQWRDNIKEGGRWVFN